MIVNFDYLTNRYVIKYQIASQEIIAYLDGRSMNDEIQEWKNYHQSICRDLIINYLNKDDKLSYHR